jgi:hypothetical protein
MTWAVMAIARCVLPEPLPPTRTRLRWVARKVPSCRLRTSAAFTGDSSKRKLSRPFMTGRPATPSR